MGTGGRTVRTPWDLRSVFRHVLTAHTGNSVKRTLLWFLVWFGFRGGVGVVCGGAGCGGGGLVLNILRAP